MSDEPDPIAIEYAEYLNGNKPIFEPYSNELLIRALYCSNRTALSIRVSDCGSSYRLVTCDDGCKSKFIMVQRCGSHLCRYCARIYAAKIREYFIKPVIAYHKQSKSKTHRFMFLTLTSNQPTTDKLPRQLLRDAKKLFDMLYPGPDQGAFFKLDIGASGNIHLHCIVYGKYVSQSVISELWQKIHGAKIIHIEQCKTPEQAANYCSKYLVKPVEDDMIPAPFESVNLEETPYFLGLCCLIRGTRRVQQYRASGIFHKLKYKPIKQICTCPICGHKVIFSSPIDYIEEPPIGLALYHSLKSDKDPPMQIDCIF